jgi:hypothetical protein
MLFNVSDTDKKNAEATPQLHKTSLSLRKKSTVRYISRTMSTIEATCPNNSSASAVENMACDEPPFVRERTSIDTTAVQPVDRFFWNLATLVGDGERFERFFNFRA